VTVTGLLRASEPAGRILRPNEPARERWFSRDVAAIASARGLADVAPFFIDADATSNPGGAPIGGMTVVRFRNAHLAYAATWFGLAALCVTGLVLLRRPGHQVFAGR
jgi:surfeit locus 1 family protein